MHKAVKWPLASISLCHIPASGSGRRAGLTQQQVAERLGRPQRYTIDRSGAGGGSLNRRGGGGVGRQERKANPSLAGGMVAGLPLCKAPANLIRVTPAHVGNCNPHFFANIG